MLKYTLIISAKQWGKLMNTAYLYLQLYRLFDDSTPVAVDCGELCEKACCHGDCDSGMLLFPGEYEVYRLLEPEWINIDKTDMTYEYNGKSYRVPIAFCSGECDRFQRPLSCRIFPLTPYFNAKGKIEIIIDPRAKSICPLAKGFNMEDYDPLFIKNVKRVFTLLMKNERFRSFMRVYSDYLDDFRKFL